MEQVAAQQIPIFELYGIWYVPLLQRLWVRVSIGIAILLLLCGAIFFAYHVWKRRKTQKRTPYQMAIGTLETVSVDVYAAQRHFDDFYIMLISTLKQYASKKFSLHPGLTDSELSVALESRVTDRAALESLFNGALYTKFAQQESALDRMKADLHHCTHIIDEIEKISIPKSLVP